ncbi:MAG: sugar transferase [Candidatus Zixiibacteriota bacterium]|nr:MAG: sugar transferase [candidate division Zixibacteria bacterium]
MILILSGQAGAHILSLISLVGTLLASGYRGLFILEMSSAVVLIRLLYCMTRGPRPVLPGRSVRRSVRSVIGDEIKIGIALAAGCFVMQWPVALVTLAIFFALNIVVQCLFSRVMVASLSADRKRARQGTCERQVLIVGTGVRGKMAADSILSTPEIETGVAGFLDYDRKGLWSYRDISLIGRPDEIDRIIAHRQIDAVFVAVEPQDLARTQSLFSTVEQMGVPICFVPQMFQPSIARMRPERINGTPLILYHAVPENQLVLAIKRLLDKAGALGVILLASPMMLLAAAAIKLTSKGPVLFRQTRSGLNGKRFTLYKFRTMCHDAEKKKAELESLNEMSGPVFKVTNDPRVTRVGRILRRASLDELPQLINVLKGDMSMVGPRPPLPEEVAKYEPWQHRKLSVTPGVTCTWQISGRNNIDFEQWMRLDLEYIDNWSLWRDTKILVRTIPAVLKGNGAS